MRLSCAGKAQFDRIPILVKRAQTSYKMGVTTRLTRLLRKALPGRKLIFEPDRRLRYPDDVQTQEERLRWDLSYEAAVKVATGIGGNEMTVLLATRSLYESDIPTSS